MKNTEKKKTKQQNWFKEFFLKNRFYMLVLGTVLGIALFLVVKEYDLLSKVFFYSKKTNKNIETARFITNLLPVILGLPIILFLWIFRTHDTKEQLDKAQTNIEQQDFHDALRMLADDKLVSQEIAVLRLIDISKKNKIYDDTIKIAFIKRMKTPYETEEVKEVEREIEKYKKDKFIKAEHNLQIKKKLIKVRRRTYAQYIFRWLGERCRVEDKLDLGNLDLSYQDFRARDNGNKIKYFRAKKGNYFVLDSVNLTGANLKEVDLTEVDLRGANLRGADLTVADLTEVDLIKVDLTVAKLKGANLTEVDLTLANLTEVDLRGVDLTEVDLRGANLTRANLTEVDLRGVDLTEVDLRGANLTGADLTGADLTGAKGPNYNRLASVKSLYEAKGLETVLKPEELTRLRAEKPELFEPPKEEQNEIKI